MTRNDKMKKKYTRKQIVESIAHWQNVLDQMNESSSQNSISELFKMAQQIVPNEADIAKKALNESDLNEGTVSGITMGIMGTLLALSMMGKISLNMKDALSSMNLDKKDAKIVQMCDKSIDQITAELDEISDNIAALESNSNASDPSLEQLIDATKKQIEKAKRQEIFDKIMAEP